MKALSRALLGSGMVLALVLTLGQRLQGEPPTAAAATPVECGAVLNRPGEYVLTRDLTCPGTAVTISADNVSLDLAGFTISGLDPVSTGIIVGDVVVDLCVPMRAPLVQIKARGGAIKGFGYGIYVCKAEGVRISGLTVTANRDGIQLDQAHSAQVMGNNISFNKAWGLRLATLAGALVEGNDISNNDDLLTCQRAPFSCGGLEVFRSGDGMIVRNNTISGNGDVGVVVRDSFRLTLENNTVTNTNSFGTPTTNIALVGGSHSNTIRGNTTGSTVPGTSAYGINVGCRDGCPFISGPTSGANGNLIQANTANNNARYGIAQAAGNTGNTYTGNSATGNGWADFAIDP